MRPEQENLLSRISDAVSCGYRHIIVCAPTGVGKSHIGVTFARHFGSSSILTAQRILQDQYRERFRFLVQARGRSNYPCMVRCMEQGVRFDDGIVRDPDTTCARGVCMWHGMRGREYCKYKPDICDFEAASNGAVVGPPGMCMYYTAKYEAALADHSLYNYAAYLHFRHQKGVRENSRCIVADEAHEIEAVLASSASVVIGEVDAFEAGVDAARLDADTITSLLESTSKTYAHRTRYGGLGESNITHYISMRDRCSSLLREIRKNPHNVVASRQDAAIRISPVSVRHMARRVFTSEHQLFMSGTIHPDMFMDAMGFDERDCAFIEMDASPFRPENRPIHYVSKVRLHGAAPPADYYIAYLEASRIAATHRMDKGLVLTTSIRQADGVARVIGDRAIRAYGDMREAAVKRHRESTRPTILVSPGLWAGLDLPDDLSRFCIVLKCPFGTLSDGRTRVMAQRSQLWYGYSALIKFLQGYGRSVRHGDDYAVTYVIDRALYDLVCRMKGYVPSAYRDTVIQ